MRIITKNEEQRKDLSRRLSGFCKEFSVYKLLGRFGAEKMRGISFQTVFDFILALVFTGRNLYQTENDSMGKDTVYRFLNSAKIHWEKILLILAVSVIARVRELTDPSRLCAML